MGSYTKRLIDLGIQSMDFVFAIIGTIVVLPLVLVLAILIKLESTGPVFYSQKRVGLHGKEFKLFKLRSMYVNAERCGPKWASKDDERITPLGRYMRRTRLDELPQFINVLQGNMSFIGPRPERASFTEEFYLENHTFLQRLRVKPGITGYAQVNGGYDLTHQQKLQHDLYYITHRSIRLNLKILLKTVAVVMGGNGAR